MNAGAPGRGPSAAAVALYWAMPAIVFGLSRWGCRRWGMEFQWRSVETLAQLLAPHLLRERLAESIWYLHAQPPLFNLLAGILLKFGDARFPLYSSAFFMATGLATYYLLLLTFHELRLSASAALEAATAVMLLPATIFYEHWFFYPYLINGLLVAAAYGFVRARGRAGGWLLWAFAMLALAVLTRSVYHPLYYLGIAAAIGSVQFRSQWRRYCLLALIPFLPVLGWAVKNQAQFGFFGTSSWAGNSLHKSAVRNARDLLPGLLAEKAISPLSTYWEFMSGDVYMKALGRDGRTGIPALDEVTKPGTRIHSVNHNHWIYPLVSRIYMKDARTIIARAPGRYWRTIRQAWTIFWRPATQDPAFDPLRAKIEAVTRVCERIESGWMVLALSVAALAGFALAAVRGRMPPGEKTLFVFIGATFLWVMAVTTLVEIDENNRMRFELYGLHAILLAGGIGHLVRSGRPDHA